MYNCVILVDLYRTFAIGLLKQFYPTLNEKSHIKKTYRKNNIYKYTGYSTGNSITQFNFSTVLNGFTLIYFFKLQFELGLIIYTLGEKFVVCRVDVSSKCVGSVSSTISCS